MTGAEYKTLRQALGLSAAEAASFHGLASDRTIRYWESGQVEVPAGAAAELRELDHRLDRAVAETVALYRHQKTELGGNPPSRVELYRYRQAQLYARSRAGREGLPIGVHAVLIDRTRRALEAEGAAVAIVYADRPMS